MMDVGNSIPFPVSNPESSSGLAPSEDASRKIEDMLVAIPRLQAQLLPVRRTSPDRILREPRANATNARIKSIVEISPTVPAGKPIPAKSDVLRTGGKRMFPTPASMRFAPPRMDKAAMKETPLGILPSRTVPCFTNTSLRITTIPTSARGAPQLNDPKAKRRREHPVTHTPRKASPSRVIRYDTSLHSRLRYLMTNRSSMLAEMAPMKKS